MAHKVRRYAQDTKVRAGVSKDEIERALRRAGAANIFSGYDDDRKMITLGWRIDGRCYKLAASTDRPTRRCEPEQLEREAWRVLLLMTKAKLEAIAQGITSFEAEFMASLLLPNGSTVAEDVLPKVAEAYETANMPRLNA
jgi:hypothetical protein